MPFFFGKDWEWEVLSGRYTPFGCGILGEFLLGRSLCRNSEALVDQIPALAGRQILRGAAMIGQQHV